MTLDHLSDTSIAHILAHNRRIALVGASNRPDRPSHGVMQYLLAQGWDVTPVNPGLAGQSLLGRPVVATLDEAGPLQLVDIFRASDQAGAVVDDAIRLGAQAVWLQLGVVDEAAAGRARAAGLGVVMDRCTAVEARRLHVRPAPPLEAASEPGHVEPATLFTSKVVP